MLKDIANFQKERISSEFLNEKTYISTENILQNFEGVQSANSIPANTNVIAYKEDDILLSNIRPYLKKVWLADRAGGCSADVFVLRSYGCKPNFLYNVIASDKFISFVMSGAKGVKMPRGDKKQMETFCFSIPSIEEQHKISRLLHLLDARIANQSKLIEDLNKLKSSMNYLCYSSRTNMTPLSKLLKQCSERNRSGMDLQVLSVSNKYGFIAQSDQFEDREVASDDTSNYKIVEKNMFAYNPARINVGSIALYEMNEKGIVSPMYVCFTTKQALLPIYLEHYFASQTFKHEMYKRLEGSVRLCLTFEGLCNIEIPLPSIEQQKKIGKYISTINHKVSFEKKVLSQYQLQRKYLLRQMFI